MWNADQYLRYKEERAQPAYDLMDYIGPRSNMRIIDLGCGSGELTKTLHERFRATETIGIDSSAEMLEKAPRSANLHFKQESIESLDVDASFDLLFSNAALHWVADHHALFAKLSKAIRPGGQIAIQIPKNGDHTAHRIGYLLEKEAPYNHYPPNLADKNALGAEEYALLLHSLGFRNIKVRMYVYLHLLASSEDTVEWLKGSFLTHYRATMPASTYEAFENEFRKRVVATLGQAQPYAYTFKRILMHAVK